LDIDNNLAELTLRHIAVGRKNWLFAGSAQGAETRSNSLTTRSSSTDAGGAAKPRTHFWDPFVVYFSA
jgi:hypothetical protein